MRINVVCELPSDGSARAPDSCTAYPAVRGAVRSSGGMLSERVAKTAEWKAAATEVVDQTQTFWQLVDLVGAGPDVCQSRSDSLRTCSWSLDSATPGFVTIARWVGKRKRLYLSCELPLGNGPRVPGSCSAY